MSNPSFFRKPKFLLQGINEGFHFFRWMHLIDVISHPLLLFEAHWHVNAAEWSWETSIIV